MLPQRSIFSLSVKLKLTADKTSLHRFPHLSRHIEHGEADVIFLQFFHLKANRRSDFESRRLLHKRKVFSLYQKIELIQLMNCRRLHIIFVFLTFLGFKWLIRVVFPELSSPITKIFASRLDSPNTLAIKLNMR